jgi:hypothetical protein
MCYRKKAGITDASVTRKQYQNLREYLERLPGNRNPKVLCQYEPKDKY